MSPERRIIQNLSGRVHGINGSAAIAGIEDHVAGRRALQILVDNNVVFLETVSDRGHTMNLYRYNTYRWTKPKLTVVTK